MKYGIFAIISMWLMLGACIADPQPEPVKLNVKQLSDCQVPIAETPTPALVFNYCHVEEIHCTQDIEIPQHGLRLQEVSLPTVIKYVAGKVSVFKKPTSQDQPVIAPPWTRSHADN